MVSDAIQQLAEELPDHQTSRGNVFRNVSNAEMESLARTLVVARTQARVADDNDWNDSNFRNAMVRKKILYFHKCGSLSIDVAEADHIWYNVVYNKPSPEERKHLV